MENTKKKNNKKIIEPKRGILPKTSAKRNAVTNRNSSLNHLIVRIEKDESDHHEVIRSPADDECCDDDDRNSPVKIF
jgi:hypothetical protein